MTNNKPDSLETGIDFEGEQTLGEVNYEVDTDSAYDEVYPDATLNIARDPASVFQLKRKYEKTPPMLKLDPEFQRLSAWNDKQKSELIESILMGIPLPLIYVKEDENGVYIIVDGRQRLATLFDFIDNKFPLKKLSILVNENGHYFSDLSDIQKNKIEDYSLTLQVIKAPTSDRVTFDLFDRVNRGGTRLNNQEMRNALYQGTSTRLIKEIASSKAFCDATDNTIPVNRMKDRYLALRLVAFYLWRKKLLKDVSTDNILSYRSNLEDFLANAMKYINRFDIDSPFVVRHKETVLLALEDCNEILEPGWFRLPSKDNNYRRPLNMYLFETIVYLLILSRENGFIDDRERIKGIYTSLINDPEYNDTLTQKLDSNTQTTRRFEIIEDQINA